MRMTDQTQKPEPEKKKRTIPDVPPIVTQHQITLKDVPLAYTAATGLMPIKDPNTDEIVAGLFYIAYTRDGIENTADRPLVFVFNGGPGSSSVWLHLGALGPRRVRMEEEGWFPRPPFRLEDNPYTWLDDADLVFIDPVGTGYSRSVDPEKSKDYWGVQKDVETVGEFIRLYLTRNKRWHSPLFLAGESYGTTRAAGLAGYLIDAGIAFNGVVLISTVLNFQTLSFDKGNDLPYPLYLPTYTATAWYHQKLPADLQTRPLVDVLTEVEAWSETVYVPLLAQGDRLTDAERREAIATLSRYTGIAPSFIDQSDLRIRDGHFFKELQRAERRTTGRLDSRFTGVDRLGVSEAIDFDPSFSAIIPPYTATFNQYIRAELNYETDVLYEILSGKVNEGWQMDQGKYADTSEALRSALAKNPYMRVFVALGYYDLATPHFAAEYTISHLELDPTLRANFQLEYYEAGHMMYLDVKSLAKLRADIAGFMTSTLG
jgi:carboxypeptidase C (cathepsin A)